MSVFSDFWDLIEGSLEDDRKKRAAITQMNNATTQVELDAIMAGLPPDIKDSGIIAQTYNTRKDATVALATVYDPLEEFLTGALTSWLETIKKYEASDPAQAKANLVKLSADVMKIAAGSAAIDGALGLAPNGLGVVSSANTKQMLAWLGVGAVVAAVAHDPVKIGLLRPYQDSLEQTFRNRRPDSGDLFAAYQQRSLSATKIDDVNAITDDLMTKIEAENETFYDTEISKWGYSVVFSNALKDSATKTLSFGNLMALAKQGRLNRGMAIFSLWGYGLDRRLMKIALEALDQANETANYEGFRAQIEPAYVEGAIDEASLREYWKKLHIPQDVQDLMMPRFRKKREAYMFKTASSAQVKERDLTVSQLTAAYTAGLTDRTKTQNDILSLGYDLAETKILLDLADARKKLPGAATLKRLPLTDYEKAYKLKIITQDKVLARMQGEYSPEDIALEKQLLEMGKA
jgi:hypothetical protein